MFAGILDLGPAAIARPQYDRRCTVAEQAGGRKGRATRKPALAMRALADLDRWLAATRLAA